MCVTTIHTLILIIPHAPPLGLFYSLRQKNARNYGVTIHLRSVVCMLLLSVITTIRNLAYTPSTMIMTPAMFCGLAYFYLLAMPYCMP